MKTNKEIKKVNTEISLNTNERLKEISNHVNRKNTAKTYNHALNLFLSEYEPTQQNLLLWLASLSTKYSINTLRTYFYAIRKYFEQNDIQLTEIVFKNFFKGLTNEKIEQNKAIKNKVKALTKNLILEHINELSPAYRAIVWALYYGAFRVSELLTLTPQNFSETAKGYTITIINAKNLKQGKEHYKFIPKTSPAYEVFKSYLSTANENEKLFKVSRQAISTTISRKWKGYTAHSLRAGFVTDAFNLGASVESVCTQTGQTLATAQNYYRQIKASDNNAVNLL